MNECVPGALSGQMKVRLLENLYSLELRHQQEPPDTLHEYTTGSRPHVASDWLCATFGSERLCVNVSCRFVDSDAGQVQARLSHSFHLLNHSGIKPPGLLDCIHHCLLCLLSPSVCWTQVFLPAPALS